ncbi:MAG: ATP synthase F1 subunit gamma [Deltaproteobacteria bacterium]|nr:ATP synthase F1 subunit gamma [Deltaproteobacteria bacterium]
MPSLKAIRTRITSVKNTRKITRAMKLVSTAKLRRAQDALTQARPYTQAISRVVSELSAVAGTDSHKLFEERPLQKAMIVVMSSDRGQAGAFNANVTKAVERYAANELSAATEVSLRIIGRKGNQYFSRRRATITSFDAAPVGANALEVAREMANRVVDDFTTGKVDRVFVVYNEFKNAASQAVRVKQILPVVTEEATALTTTKADAPGSGDAGDFIYEPNKQVLLDRLVPLYVQILLYRAALESITSFFAAQMTAMENATKNAGDMISALTLQFNRARQASITKELAEIVGGAEALKG